MMNGFVHLIYNSGYNARIFIPLKYQTMIEISAYSGFDLAIGLCHIFGFGNFIKDAEKGYNIITKYYENNKNDSLSQNILGFLHYIKIEPLKGFETEDNKKKHLIILVNHQNKEMHMVNLGLVNAIVIVMV